jgi:hypothetical protein
MKKRKIKSKPIVSLEEEESPVYCVNRRSFHLINLLSLYLSSSSSNKKKKGGLNRNQSYRSNLSTFNRNTFYPLLLPPLPTGITQKKKKKIKRDKRKKTHGDHAQSAPPTEGRRLGTGAAGVLNSLQHKGRNTRPLLLVT